METIKVNTSQHVDIDYPVAGLGERIAARLIDLGIFLGLYLIFIVLVVLTGISGSLKGTPYFIIGLMIIYGASYVFYNLICEIFMNGQCVGKRLMKIKVISLDGSQPSLGQYFIRWLFRLVDFVFTAQVGGLICVAVSKNKQRIGDIVAGTTVIKTVPHTNFNHIAFHPVEEDYVPVFSNVNLLTDRDVELIHEVIDTYYKTHNTELIYTMSAKVATLLSISIPEGMNEMEFLKTVIKDYNYQTAISL
ncbi:MAG: RDD family protein [Candidatus Pedobacter colombiensis]|uniref:RDD family protein n=1 Tax=Candidatus Pedobacter colombiensis TaxID=3121371 RepID=A0AAJ5W8E7_9SPHI|nr:RDD family protein [Pedobacter sp.]WEK19093.1 MAG: RDD family protein [Pedobacter sp.]